MSKCDKHGTPMTVQEVPEYPGKTREVCAFCEEERRERMSALFGVPRHGCGPGEALPADTNCTCSGVIICASCRAAIPTVDTEPEDAQRKALEELEIEFYRVLEEHVRPLNWHLQQRKYKRLADLAGQIAGRTGE